MAPATGCPRPHTRFWIASDSAKISRLHSRVSVIGTRNRPSTERGPKERSEIMQPATMTSQSAVMGGLVRRVGTGVLVMAGLSVGGEALSRCASRQHIAVSVLHVLCWPDQRKFLIAQISFFDVRTAVCRSWHWRPATGGRHGPLPTLQMGWKSPMLKLIMSISPCRRFMLVLRKSGAQHDIHACMTMQTACPRLTGETI